MIESLVEYAEHEFTLGVPDQSGVTTREHLEQVERSTGRTPKELIGPEFPFALRHVWLAFLSLSKSRPIGFNGPMAITYRDMKDYSELTGVPLSPWEVSAIEAVDRVYLKVANG